MEWASISFRSIRHFRTLHSATLYEQNNSWKPHLEALNGFAVVTIMSMRAKGLTGRSVLASRCARVALGSSSSNGNELFNFRYES